jgi:hypothetical protein
MVYNGTIPNINGFLKWGIPDFWMVYFMEQFDLNG